MKIKFIIIAFLASALSQAQTTQAEIKPAKKFFKSYEDFKAKKPIEGMKLVSFKASSIEFTENGKEQKQKGSKITYTWFCNDYGMLMRVFEGDVYFVVVDGALCYYIKRGEGTVIKPVEGDYIFNPITSDPFLPEYYSETPNGPIIKLKEKVMDGYLEKYRLKDQFDKDPLYQREAKDCVWCYKNKLHCRNVKYIRLIGERMK